MAEVILSGLTKFYAGLRTPAVDDVSISIPAGGFLTLLGPSGCGKSSTLRLVAGLSHPDRGQILMDGKDVTRLGPAERKIGMVFQSLALFPHLTVTENVRFGLKMRGASDQLARVGKVLERVELGHLAGRYPHQLSGGQQQRVALARALVVEPSILILDEPFSALDRKLREAMQLELYRITRDLGITALFVTHDQEEALTLSDQVVVMNGGRIEQSGPPREIYSAPRSRFVAEFMGLTNFLPAQLSGDVIEFEGARARLRSQPEVQGACEVALRPEKLSLHVSAPEGPALTGVMVETIYQGAASACTVRLPSGRQVTARVAEALPVGVGTNVWVSWTPDALHAFSA